MPNIYIKTLGCKVNTFDAHAIENQLLERGFSIVDSAEKADVSIINSCSVTETAEKDARYLLRKFKSINPEGKRIITGCYAQIDSGNIAELDTVDVVIPNEAKHQFGSLLENYLKDTSTVTDKIPNGMNAVRSNRQGHFKSSATLFNKVDSRQTRAFIKIQDGCNGFCAYCQIPYARGASRSVPIEPIVSEVKRLVESGTKEIVLAGIHIGDYGDDFAEKLSNSQVPLLHLLEQLASINGLVRIRISSLEPAEFSEPLADFINTNHEKFCAHFHFPLQSGTDSVLKRMRRTYDTARYQRSVERAKEIFPDCFIGADIIPGFPGETDEDFEDTLSFIKSVGLSALHVFPYSKRPNTAALRMPDHVDEGIKKKRSLILRELSNELEIGYYKRWIGKEAQVIWENDHDNEGRLIGKSSNYLTVVASNNLMQMGIQPGDYSKVKLNGLLASKKILGTSIQ